MSALADVESAVVSLLAGITSGSGKLFRSVAGFSDPDRRRAVARLGRTAAPSALVVYTGRLRPDASFGVVGSAALSVFLRAENLRGGDDPRSGDTASSGGFDLLEQSAAVLDGAVVLTDQTLVLTDELVSTADDTHVVYEQRYAVQRLAETSQPTFNGQAIAGGSSTVRVVVGDIETDDVRFAFPGIDGVFQHRLGLRERAITWQGLLRAADDTTLDALEAAFEAAVADPQPHDLIDGLGRTFSDCVARRFVRVGPRRRHPTTGQRLQPFEMHFGQLNP